MREVHSDTQHWNVVAIAIFTCVAGAAFWFMDRFYTTRPVDFLDLALLALATFRVSHLITNDKIFDFVRILVFDQHGTRLEKAEKGWRRALCDLMECLWCVGLWSALIVMLLYSLDDLGRKVVILLAVAGAAAILSLVTKRIASERPPP